MKEKHDPEKTEDGYLHLVHMFPPVYDQNAKVLILGTFPSVKSREGMFYYNHPRNRFWQVTAALCGTPVPVTIEEKIRMLLSGHLAVWDVIQECDIKGSDDSSIKNVIPVDLEPVLKGAPIRSVYANGQTAARLYNRYCRQKTGLEITALPSTSPANAAWSLERLVEAWKVIGEQSSFSDRN